MLNYGERLRKQRKVLHRGLHDENLVLQYALIQENVLRSCHRFLESHHPITEILSGKLSTSPKLAQGA